MQHTTDVLIVGSGEYTTGFTSAGGSQSDKKAGVVALVFFDLRHRMQGVGRILICGVDGTKFPAIRTHLDTLVGKKYGMDTSFESFPADTVSRDPHAYRAAIATLRPESLVVIFTPDDTHFRIAKEAIEAGHHVLVTKPAVKTLAEHEELCALAKKHDRLVAVEMHKRFDPLYSDARERFRSGDLGDFSFFQSYMSQPKKQLHTFAAWAGKSSDISYYLNSHHIDFHASCVSAFARPVTVFAVASTGVANDKTLFDLPETTEDTITLTVQWENVHRGTLGTAVYTSSWIAPRSDVHSQQRFFLMGTRGEINIDQAHRGYSMATDDNGYMSQNPLFMRYAPGARGEFAGQSGYGYVSFSKMFDAVQQIFRGAKKRTDYAGELATIEQTRLVTAILEAGRLSLDMKCTVDIKYSDTDPADKFTPTAVVPQIKQR